jgi:hypothetical protein
MPSEVDKLPLDIGFSLPSPEVLTFDNFCISKVNGCST